MTLHREAAAADEIEAGRSGSCDCSSGEAPSRFSLRCRTMSGLRNLVASLFLALALVSAAPAQAPETRPSRPYEEAFARGDQHGMLRLALEAIRALTSSFSEPAAEGNAEILLLRAHSILSNDPASTLAALDQTHLRGWMAARASFARHAALSDLGRFSEAQEEARRI